MKKIKKYEKSITYRVIMSDIESGDINSAFSLLIPNPPDKKNTSAFSLIEILKEAYDLGNHTDELIETLKGAVRMYLQEMCDEGLINQTGPREVSLE